MSLIERQVDTHLGPTRVWEMGGGQPLVFFAGLAGLPRWLPFLDHLTKMRRVICPSLPGYPGGPGAQMLDSHLDWIIAALDAVRAAEAPRVDLIGASVGAALAAECAAVAPGEIGSLVLLSPYGLYESDEPSTDVFAQKPGEISPLLSEQPAKLSEWLSPPVGSDQGDWEVQNLRAAISSASILWPLGDTGLRKRLPRISARTLVLWGGRDRVLPESYGRRFVDGIGPNASLHVIPNAGHQLEFDEPSVAAEIVLEFLSGR